MKIFTISPKTAIQVVVSGVVIGSLVGRDYPQGGVIVSSCFIGFYLLVVSRRRIIYWLHLRPGGYSRRLLAVSWVCLLYLFFSALFAERVYNFFLLIVLAVDYFLHDKHQREADQSK